MPVSTIATLPSQIKFGTQTPGAVQRSIYGKTYEFDFTTGEFVRGLDGKVTVLDDVDTLKQVVVKLLNTARYHFLAYDGQYGVDIWDLLQGDAPVGSSTNALLVHYVLEALTASPLVRTVLNIAVTSTGPYEAHVTADVLDVFGTQTHIDAELHN